MMITFHKLCYGVLQQSQRTLIQVKLCMLLGVQKGKTTLKCIALSNEITNKKFVYYKTNVDLNEQSLKSGPVSVACKFITCFT